MDKITSQKWTDRVYKIQKVFNKLNLPQYTVELNGDQLKRRFYNSELQRVITTPETRWRIEKVLRYRTRNNIREGLVRWSGYDKNFDQWMPVEKIAKLS
jgi:hypothetical protein